LKCSKYIRGGLLFLLLLLLINVIYILHLNNMRDIISQNLRHEGVPRSHW